MLTQATVKGVGPLQRGSTSRSIVAYSFTVRTESIKELPATMSQVRFPAPIRALHKTISTTTFIQSKTSTSTNPSIKFMAECKHSMAKSRIPVLLPDMFVLFLAQKPRVNPHYETVKTESEAWINRSAP